MSLLKIVNGKNPRQIAVRILQQRRANGEFTEDLLENALAGAQLPPADRALCREIVYGAVRWQATLDWLIARKTAGRKQKPALQNLLRLGLYQIFWLDRIPSHAAVNETVELARQNGFGAQAGFVNALLRGCLREADGIKKLLADLKISQPALGWSHPDWLVARWQKRWGAEKTAQLLEWNNTPSKTFARVNTLKLAGAARQADRTPGPGVPALLEKWREENVEYDFVRRDFLGKADPALRDQDARQRVPTDFENLVFELKSHPPLMKLESFQQGWFYIQDPGTLLAACKLGPQPGETILDLCAAPGGKTTFIAQLMNNQGRIVAMDNSRERLKLLEENCVRLGVTCVETDFPSTLNSLPGQSGATTGQPSTGFDRVLVDAPCSNTGVMRRRLDLRWRIQPAEIRRLHDLQLSLLKRAALQVKSGGVLVYSTCSLEPEENAEVVKQFLHEHKDFKLEDEMELLPFADQVDGAYVARLKRLP
jgi:16S rRNA (cytosine967-C5)-methyltransferase